MQASTGRTFTSFDLARAAGVPLNDLVMVEGPPEAIEMLSRRARMGAREAEKRAKKRKQQQASRRRNR